MRAGCEAAHLVAIASYIARRYAFEGSIAMDADFDAGASLSSRSEPQPHAPQPQLFSRPYRVYMYPPNMAPAYVAPPAAIQATRPIAASFAL